MSVYRYSGSLHNNAVCSKIWTMPKVQQIHSGRTAHYIQIQTISEVQQIHSLVDHTLYPDTNNIQSTRNLLSGRSRHCIQFTPKRVHNTRTLHPLVSSSRHNSFIASEYHVRLSSDVQRLYTAMEMARRL